MKAARKRVLLAAGIDAVGLSRLPRLFHEAGFEVHVLAPRRLAVMRSRFVAKRTFGEPGQLRQFLATNDLPYERIVLAEEWALLNALEGEDLEWMRNWSPVPLTPPSIARIKSKTQFLVDCRNAGIPVPEFEICPTREAVMSAAAKMGFPVFVKATRGMSGSGLRYAVNGRDLEPQLAAFDFGDPVIVQREIQGITGAISVLYNPGRPPCWFAYLMRQTWPNRFSSACSIEFAGIPGLQALVERVGCLTEFNGLAGIDFIWSPESSSLHILELNPRPGPTYYLGPRAGVSFSEALSGRVAGGEPKEQTSVAGRIVHMFPQALYHAIDNGRPGQFVRALADAPWDDPALAGAHLRRLATHYLLHRH